MAQPGNPFVGTSEMAARMRAFDWSGTPLGPVDAWPQSLRTVVRVMLTSRYAMWMGWGPELTFLYNDAYGAMTLGAKHPWALGRPAREVWAEIWPDIGPRIEHACWRRARRPGTRSCCCSSSAAAIPRRPTTRSLQPGARRRRARVGGMLCVVTEETERVIGERRLASLRELGGRARATQTRSRIVGGGRSDARGGQRARPAVHADLPRRAMTDDDGDAAASGDVGVGARRSAASAASTTRCGRWPVAVRRRRASAPVVVDRSRAALRRSAGRAWARAADAAPSCCRSRSRGRRGPPGSSSQG